MATRQLKPPKRKRRPKALSLPERLTPRGRARLYADCPADLVNRTKAAASATGMTVAEIVQRAVTAELARLEAERGQKFESRPIQLTPGRPRRRPKPEGETMT